MEISKVSTHFCNAIIESNIFINFHTNYNRVTSYGKNKIRDEFRTNETKHD